MSPSKVRWKSVVAGLITFAAFDIHAATWVIDPFTTDQSPLTAIALASTTPVPDTTSFATSPPVQLGEITRVGVALASQSIYDPETQQYLLTPEGSVTQSVSDGTFVATFNQVLNGYATLRYTGFNGDDFTRNGAVNAFQFSVKPAGIDFGAIEVDVVSAGTYYRVGQALLYTAPPNLNGIQMGTYPYFLTNSENFVDVEVPFVDFSQWNQPDIYQAVDGVFITLRAFGIPAQSGSLVLSNFALSSASVVPVPPAVVLMLTSLGVLGVWTHAPFQRWLRARP
jgi:hypothetical protein